MTFNTIATRALRLITAIQPGETPEAAEIADALITANGMIDQWATQRLTMWALTRSLFTLVSGQAAYTIGAGGDFDTTRPVYLPRVSVITNTSSAQNTLELPLEMLSAQQWQGTVPIKLVQGALPTKCYYDYAFSSLGLGTVNYWPVPNVGSLQTALYLPAQLSQFADAATSYLLPPGYADAITYGLAVRIAPEYGRPIDPTILGLAQESLANIKRANIRIEELRTDMALNSASSGLYNWISDSWA